MSCTSVFSCEMTKILYFWIVFVIAYFLFTYPTLSSIFVVEIVGKLHVDRLQEMKLSVVRHIRVYLLDIVCSCIQLCELLSP